MSLLSTNTLFTGLKRPYGLALDGSNNFVIAEFGFSLGSSGVRVVSPAGTQQAFLAGGQVGRLRGVAVDGGDLIALDGGFGTPAQLFRIPAGGGSPQRIAGNLGVGFSVAVISPGVYVVTDGFNGGRLFQVDSGGAVTEIASGLGFAYGVAVEGSSLIVTDLTGARLLRITPGSPVFTEEVLVDSGLQQPRGVEVESPGIYLVADFGSTMGSGRLLRINTNVTPPVIQSVASSGIGNVNDVVALGIGDYAVTDFTGNRLIAIQEDIPVYSSSPAPGDTIDLGMSSLGVVTSPQEITVSELGNAPVDVSAPQLTGANPGDFAVVPTTAFSIADGGADQIVSITCTPTVVGSRTATLNYTTTDPLNPTVTYPLTCEGTPALIPGFSSTPASGSTVDLGSILVGQTTPQQTITVTEVGTAPLNVSAPILAGANPGDFTVVPSTAFSIADGGSAQDIDITCTPSAAGSRTATLNYTTNDPGNATVSYDLTCVGLVPGYGSNPAPNSTINFGSTDVGSPTSQILTISETGDATLSISSASISGPNDSDFSVISPTFPFSITDGGSGVDVTIQCNPSAEGTRTATLSIAHNGANIPSPVTYPLTCEGNPTGIVVTNLNDSGPGSLTAAINTANSNPGVDTITFDPTLSGGLIPIAGFFPNVTETVIIQGPTGGVILDGDPITFSANSGVTVTLDSNVQVGNGFNDPITIAGAGTFIFQGRVNVEESSGPAVVNITSSGLTQFQGGLTINGLNDDGLQATSGTIEVFPNTNNEITTTNGRAVDLTNATLGANGVTFRQINVNGSDIGILLNNIGSTGTFRVTGNGCSQVGGDGTGGTIISSDVEELLGGTTADDGILLLGTVRASFNCMIIRAGAGGGAGSDAGLEAFANGSRIDVEVRNTTFEAQDASTGAVEIDISPVNSGQIFASVIDNEFLGFPDGGILLEVPSSDSSTIELDATITNNQFTYGPTNTNFFQTAIIGFLENGNGQYCADLRLNSILSGSGLFGDYVLDGGSVNLDIPGLTPSPANNTQIATFVTNQNTSGTANYNVAQGINAPCSLPVLP